MNRRYSHYQLELIKEEVSISVFRMSRCVLVSVVVRQGILTTFYRYFDCFEEICVRLDVFLVRSDRTRMVNVERITVFHQKFLGSKQSEFGSLLFAKFVTNLQRFGIDYKIMDLQQDIV